MSGRGEFSDQYYAALSDARERFSARLGSDVAKMTHYLQNTTEMSQGKPLDALDQLHHRLHEITGSAGMLGLEAIHRQGRRVLKIVERAVDCRCPLDDHERRAVSSFLSHLADDVENSTTEK